MKIDKKINFINKWLTTITQILMNVFVFAVICGLLFNDPFGVISSISNLITNVSDNGMAGLISLLVITFWYKR